MDLELLFSNQVSDYITEVNKKYPDISSSEFCKMVEEFAEKNKANIIEEAIDMDEFDEPTDKPSPSDADEEDIDKEPESDGEPSGEPSGEPESKEEKLGKTLAWFRRKWWKCKSAPRITISCFTAIPRKS